MGKQKNGLLFKKHWKIVAMMVIILTLLVGTQIPAGKISAHNRDLLDGRYTSPYTQSNLTFRIEPSAITSLLTSDVYYSAFAWGGISGNVGNVGIAMYAPGLPSTGFFSVIGEIFGDDNIKGRTVGYDSYGYSCPPDMNWTYAKIIMNNKTTIYSDSTNPINAAKKTFVHEVGHVYKLAHPEQNSSLNYHVYNGRPYAVMNQGYPEDYIYIAGSVAYHDETNLIAKWGA
ncbi:MAG: hypothetical protein IJL07_07425 [Lachnospiraceae bacterium]|nr:hypothetical protein [Lachnospiraceae bacterium]